MLWQLAHEPGQDIATQFDKGHWADATKTNETGVLSVGRRQLGPIHPSQLHCVHAKGHIRLGQHAYMTKSDAYQAQMAWWVDALSQNVSTIVRLKGEAHQEAIRETLRELSQDLRQLRRGVEKGAGFFQHRGDDRGKAIARLKRARRRVLWTVEQIRKLRLASARFFSPHC